jgi:hypothetical protein
MRKAAIVLITVVVGFAIGFVCVELLAVVLLFLQDGSYVPARERFQREMNRYVQDVTRGGPGCQYIDSLFPHPYLAFVHHGNPPCGVPDINNIGLFGPDFPSERIRDRFVVLVTGGSVAAQFGQLNRRGPRYLEVILNEAYVSPTGKPFLVLNGGVGAWKQPQQTILFLLYSDVVDAVVTLDGYNEYVQLGRPSRFEYPANQFVIINPFAADRYDLVIARWLVGRLVGYASQNPILSRSQAAFMVLRGTRRWVEGTGFVRERRTTMRSLFQLPEEWDEERRVEWATSQYRKYIRGLNALARERKVLAASFIQPVPAIGKRLTTEERMVVGDLGYGPLYQRMADSLLSLGSEGIQVFSLLQIFREVDTSLYVDHVHLARDAQGESAGYRRMAEHMARRLAESWNLRRKK